MTNYFRFSGKSDTDIFPRVDRIVSVTNTTMEVLISSTTENAGPLIMSFMYVVFSSLSISLTTQTFTSNTGTTAQTVRIFATGHPIKSLRGSLRQIPPLQEWFKET